MDNTMEFNVSKDSIQIKNKVKRELKITIIGGGAVGKSCIVYTYVNNQFLDHYDFTVFNEYSKRIKVDGQTYVIRLLDTSGLQEYKLSRTQNYAGTDCFIICYSIGYRSSFDRVESYWYPEIKNHCNSNNTEVPIILVGTKSDIRHSNRECIPMSEGDELRRKINAVKYIECSALNNENVSCIFEEAVRATNRKRFNCCILL